MPVKRGVPAAARPHLGSAGDFLLQADVQHGTLRRSLFLQHLELSAADLSSIATRARAWSGAVVCASSAARTAQAVMPGARASGLTVNVDGQVSEVLVRDQARPGAPRGGCPSLASRCGHLGLATPWPVPTRGPASTGAARADTLRDISGEAGRRAGHMADRDREQTDLSVLANRLLLGS